MMRQGHGTRNAILVTLGMPLFIVATGFWQWHRSAADGLQLERQRAELTRAERWLDGGGRSDRLQFRHHGQLYAGPLAAAKVREALDDARTGLAIAGVRDRLPPLVILGGALSALLTGLVMAGSALLARAGLRSRDRLVGGFSLLRRGMPAVLGTLVLLPAMAAALAALSELLALAENGNYSDGAIKVLLIAVIVAGGSLWTAFRAVRQLRGTLALFTPEPMPILGRVVTEAEAPGLWCTLDALADRLGSLRPENVVVGLAGGFFVSSGPKRLQPGGIHLGGRTLYVPLPQLALVTPDEASAIISHELAHFSGEDTEYSLRFLPIYAGIDRSLRAVLAGGGRERRTLSLLVRPASELGGFVMERFHRVVQHWSRQREFVADAAGASATGMDAMAGALLRTAAAAAVIETVLGAAFAAPDTAAPDLVAATLARASAGLDDPSPELQKSQPHPTDSHPPTIQRLRALGREPDEAMLAAAAAPPGPAGLGRFFAEPAALCSDVTSDFLEQGRLNIQAAHSSMRRAAASVPQDERALRVDRRSTGIGLAGVGLAMGAFGTILLRGGLPNVPWVSPIGALAAFLGLAIAGWGAWSIARTPQPFLLLRPDGMQLPGLDHPIAWVHVADFDMLAERGRITTRVLLASGAPFPGRAAGTAILLARRIRLDTAGRIVTFVSGVPRGLNLRAFAALLTQYRIADDARRRISTTASNPADQE